MSGKSPLDKIGNPKPRKRSKFFITPAQRRHLDGKGVEKSLEKEFGIGYRARFMPNGK